jgi:hypothetical protein
MTFPEFVAGTRRWVPRDRLVEHLQRPLRGSSSSAAYCNAYPQRGACRADEAIADGDASALRSSPIWLALRPCCRRRSRVGLPGLDRDLQTRPRRRLPPDRVRDDSDPGRVRARREKPSLSTAHAPGGANMLMGCSRIGIHYFCARTPAVMQMLNLPFRPLEKACCALSDAAQSCVAKAMPHSPEARSRAVATASRANGAAPLASPLAGALPRVSRVVRAPQPCLCRSESFPRH